jgi:hypothetical protein
MSSSETYYLHGGCADLADAVQRRFGWPLAMLMLMDEDGEEGVHVFNRIGSDEIFDGKGCRPLATMVAEYAPPEEQWEIDDLPDDYTEDEIEPARMAAADRYLTALLTTASPSA